MSDLKIKKVTVAAKKTALKSGRTLRTAGSREKEDTSQNPPDPQRYALRQISTRSKKVAERGILAVTFSAKTAIKRKMNAKTPTSQNPLSRVSGFAEDRMESKNMAAGIGAAPVQSAVSARKRKTHRRKNQWEAVRQKQRRAQLLSLTSGGILLLVLVVILILSIAAGAYGTDISDESLAGEGSTAIVMIASSQIGKEGGEEYWRWYGFTSHVDWCAIFVSWCADQAGLLEDGSMPKFAVCDDGIAWFMERRRWITGADREFIPPAGTIIFFDWDQNGMSDHVGIVEKCEGRFVYTIEGNSRDVCRRRCYPLGSGTIAGYGIMEYREESLQ
ncbi:MAG: CHAP domain-containing protein [Anaerovoracaceae bacterium]